MAEASRATPPFPPRDDDERAALRQWIRETPLMYGVWRDFKQLYKAVEASDERAMQAALIARLDAAPTNLALDDAPNLWGGVEAGGSVAVRGEHAFLLSGSFWDSNQQFHSFDIRNPLRPRHLGSLPVSRARALFARGNLLTVWPYNSYGNDDQCLFVDISDPSQPRRLASLSLTQSPRGIAMGDGVVGYTHEKQWRGVRSGLQLVDNAQPEQPRLAGHLEVQHAEDVAFVGNFAFITYGQGGFSWSRLPTAGGLLVADISDLDHPKQIATLRLNDASYIRVAGDHAFVQSNSGGDSAIHIIEIAQPRRPREIASFKTNGVVQEFIVRDDTMYIQLYSGLRIVDVATPSQPRTVSELALGGFYAQAMDVHDDFIFLAAHYGQTAVINISNPEQPFRVGDTPKAPTMGYMKRRARRFLKRLAESEPATFVEVAAEVLQSVERKSLDEANQWIAMDLLFGGGDRYAQRRHGRGAYYLAKPRFHLKQREERASAAWDARPDLARQLWDNAKLPWQTHEAAYKMLRAGGEDVAPLENINRTRAARFLESESPLLIRLATRRVAAWMASGDEVKAETAARAFFLSSAPLRRAIESHLPGYATTDAWSRRFSKTLFELIRGGLSDNSLSRRQAAAVGLLATGFRGMVSSRELLPFLASLLASEQAELVEWALEAVRAVSPGEVDGYLQTLATLPAASRERALAALLEGVRDKAFELRETLRLAQDDSAGVRAMGWQVLEASATPPEVLRALWERLFEAAGVTPVLQTAMTSASALAVLDRAGFAADELAAILRAKPFLVALFSAEVFARVAGRIPSAVALQLVAEAPAAQWSAVRGEFAATLSGARLASFWQAVWSAGDISASASLFERVLHDELFAATFRELEEADFDGLLRTENPLFGALLLGWLEAHAGAVNRGDALLLDAATHPLPPVRDWGLSRVRAVGMEMPFALRLLESELPPSVAAGREYFETTTEDALDLALALCDSPVKAVRAYGRAFVEQRDGALNFERLLPRLAENPNPEMQAFVAARLLQDAVPAAPPEFDEAVLRERNRGRRAKELVKQRLAAASPNEEAPDMKSSVDVATLLEIARSRTPRDAEWALSLLARRALGGENIEGLEVDGVAGI